MLGEPVAPLGVGSRTVRDRRLGWSVTTEVGSPECRSLEWSGTSGRWYVGMDPMVSPRGNCQTGSWGLVRQKFAKLERLRVD
jgi:hypothetical protein